MTDKHNYQIYALVSGKYAFVGKTEARETRPILLRHLRGANKYTAPHYQNAGESLQMHILTSVHGDHRMGYRYVIAFARLMQDMGYLLLNSPSILAAASDIYPPTQQILDTIKGTPLQQWLSADATALPESKKPQLATTKRDPITTKNPASERMTVRMTPEEKARFDDYAHQTGVTQRQALQLLLRNQQSIEPFEIDWSCDDYVRMLLNPYRDQIARLTDQVSALKEELKNYKKEKTEKQKQMDKLLRSGVCQYIDLLIPASPNALPLEWGSYKTASRSLSPSERYFPPDEVGFFLFHPEHLLWGKGPRPPIFVCGRGPDGKKMRLRYYPKSDYLGIPITNEHYGTQESVWFVGTVRAADGAAELILSLPLPFGSDPSVAAPTDSRSLDAVLRDAIAQSYWRFD